MIFIKLTLKLFSQQSSEQKLLYKKFELIFVLHSDRLKMIIITLFMRSTLFLYLGLMGNLSYQIFDSLVLKLSGMKYQILNQFKSSVQKQIRQQNGLQSIYFIYKNFLLKQARMIFHQSGMRTEFKDSLLTTDRKTHKTKEYCFASPFGHADQKDDRFSQIKFRSPLGEQDIQDYNRIKTELKKGIELAKQNINFNQSNQYVTFDEYNSLNQEHKYEIERLLFEIKKLHQTIYEVQAAKIFEIQRKKQESDNMALIERQNLRNSHAAQIQMLETQLRKTKQLLCDKSAEYQNIIKRQDRQIKHLNNQTNNLNSQIRSLIEQKNNEIEIRQKSNVEKLSKLQQEHEKQQTKMQENYSKQLNKLNKLIEIKENKLKQTQNSIENIESENGKLLFQIQTHKQKQLSKIGESEMKAQQKYELLKKSLQQQSSDIITEITKNYLIKEQILQNQISQLRKLLTFKNQDLQKIISIHEERLSFTNSIRADIENENQDLKDKLFQFEQAKAQQLELMKVKIAALHQNDLKLLVKTYETKIQCLISSNQENQQSISRLRSNLSEQTNERYEMRIKYSMQISKLNQKIIKLRSGLSAMENDMKQKLQNEKSMLLLASRSLIKDIETKEQNAKVYQIELTKLQQAYRKLEQSSDQTGKKFDEKIRIVTQEFERLSGHIVEEKKRHQQTENTYKQIVKVKDEAIKKLQDQLNSSQSQQFDNSKQIQMIEKLKCQLHELRLENGKLKDQCEFLDKKIKITKAELDQYQMEHQINNQEAKKEFQRISNQNMDQFKQFYQGRITSLEQQKLDLKEIISSKQQKITSLVQKYHELENTMRSTLEKIKRVTDLENKVMSLGIDNNLVKNMAQIVRSPSQQQ